MKAFQFYVKDTAAVNLDINSESFLEEKSQLVEQGFAQVGDIIQAENSTQAFEKFKTAHLDELGQFAGFNIVFGGFASLLFS